MVQDCVHRALPLLALALLAQLPCAAAAPVHFVAIIVDDWGHNNWGLHAKSNANAAEVQTPNIDALAGVGITLSRHYAFQYCSPSRSALHTGRNPIHVNVLNSDLAAVNLADPVSGFAGIPRNMTAFPQRLRDDAGYSTVQAGKWHLGLATPDHTPHGRGYAQSLSYLDGANDYFTSLTGDWCGSASYTDLWASTTPAYGQNSSWSCSQANQAPGCRYEDDQFTAFAVQAIQAHNASAPFMLYFAPHSVHMPLEVPAAQLARFANVSMDSVPRRFYAAMTNYVDFHIGQVVAALKAQGMWENCVLFLFSDNGGPIYGGGSGCTSCNGNAGANNYPLKGGKHSNFEGGVRVNALVSGGYVPLAMRGTTLTALTAMEDVYRTVLGLAGLDAEDARAAAAGLPAVEGFDLWPLLSGANATPPRTEVWLGSSAPRNGQLQGSSSSSPGGTPATFVQGLIRADGWKLLHDVLDNAVWQGPFYPNATTAAHPWNNSYVDCGTAAAPTCLFNVFEDPGEHVNQALARPDIVAAMAARLAELQAGVFSPERGQPSPLACKASKEKWGGFVGPFLP